MDVHSARCSDWNGCRAGCLQKASQERTIKALDSSEIGKARRAENENKNTETTIAQGLQE